MASRKLEDLHPNIRGLAVRFVDECKLRGIDVLIYCTYRTQDEQDELYTHGRTAPGPVVTWTRKSKHSHTGPGFSSIDGDHKNGGIPAALAFDAVPIACGRPDWNNRRAYKKMDKIAEKLGLEKVRGDSPHYQIDL